MPPPVQPTLFIVGNLCPSIYETKLDQSVCQYSVIIMNKNHLLLRFNFATKSANLTVTLRAFTARIDR